MVSHLATNGCIIRCKWQQANSRSVKWRMCVDWRIDRQACHAHWFGGKSSSYGLWA